MLEKKNAFIMDALKDRDEKIKKLDVNHGDNLSKDQIIEQLEKEFIKYPGQTLRACLNLATNWRTGKLAKLQAYLIVSDPEITVLLDGSGNCIEIENGVVAIGSGGLYPYSKLNSFKIILNLINFHNLKLF